MGIIRLKLIEFALAAAATGYRYESMKSCCFEGHNISARQHDFGI